MSKKQKAKKRPLLESLRPSLLARQLMISVFRRECSRRLVATTHRQDLGLPAVGDTRSARPSAALSRSRLPDGVRGPGVRGPGGRGAAARARRRVPRPRPLLRARVRSRRRRPRRWPRRWPRDAAAAAAGRGRAARAAKLPPRLAAVERRRAARLDGALRRGGGGGGTGVGGAPSHGRCLPDAEEDLFPPLLGTTPPSRGAPTRTGIPPPRSPRAERHRRDARGRAAEAGTSRSRSPTSAEDPEIRRLVLGGHRGDFFSEEGDDDDYAAAASGVPPLDPVEPFPVGPPGIRALREAVRDKKVALEKTKTFAAATNPRPREEEEEEPPGGSVPDAPSAAFDQLAETLSRRLAHAALTPAQRHAIPLALAGATSCARRRPEAGRRWRTSSRRSSGRSRRNEPRGKTKTPRRPATPRRRGTRARRSILPLSSRRTTTRSPSSKTRGSSPRAGVSADDSADLSAAFASVSAGAGYGRRRRAREPGRPAPGGVRAPRPERSLPAEPKAEGASDAEGESESDDASLGASLGACASVTPPPARPSVLILVPTRELATQVSLQARRSPSARASGSRRSTSGQSVKPQLEQLARAPAVVVGTPGRTLTCAVDEPYLDLTRVATLVLDEADQMVDMGFAPQVREILRDAGVPGPASAAAARGRRKISPPRKRKRGRRSGGP